MLVLGDGGYCVIGSEFEFCQVDVDGCSTTWMYLMLPNLHLKVIKMVNFIWYTLYHKSTPQMQDKNMDNYWREGRRTNSVTSLAWQSFNIVNNSDNWMVQATMIYPCPSRQIHHLKLTTSALNSSSGQLLAVAWICCALMLISCTCYLLFLGHSPPIPAISPTQLS